jgi:hypothetical protein
LGGERNFTTLCAPFLGHMSFKAGMISCYFLSLMPKVAKSKIAEDAAAIPH